LSDCIIEIPINSVTETLDAARKALEGYGGRLLGDSTSGELHAKTPVGDIEAKYAVANELLTIRVIKKPRLAPCKAVRKVITLFFEQLST
jgi:hypothetical protein